MKAKFEDIDLTHKEEPLAFKEIIAILLGLGTMLVKIDRSLSDRPIKWNELPISYLLD